VNICVSDAQKWRQVVARMPISATLVQVSDIKFLTMANSFAQMCMIYEQLPTYLLIAVQLRRYNL